MRSIRVGAAVVLLLAGVIPIPQGEVTAGGDETGGAVVPNEIVVDFRDSLPSDVESWVERLEGTLLIAEPEFSWVSARFESEEAANGAIRIARDRTDVSSAHHDRIVKLLSHEFSPNDPLYQDQWGYPAARAPGAWGITLGSHNVSVAVLDSGISGLHPDLESNLCGPHKSYTTTPPLTDLHPLGHGTHVAGTIAAIINNSVGVSGMSQSCLMSVKVIAGDDSQESWLASGISWAVQNGAQVISMSVGSPFPLPLVERAAEAAYLARVVLVAAAGNDLCDPSGNVVYPARYSTVIAVTALTPPLGEWGGASCGPEMELSAPGGDIWSTIPEGYGSLSGTSQAAPHVSGTIALMKAVSPSLEPPAVRSILNSTADDIEEPGWDIRTGWGRLNATAAVATAAGP